MLDQDEANLDIFESDFVGGHRDFSAWLNEYLSSGDAYPFLMGGPRQYDLGDLLRALLPPAKVAGHRILETAFQKGLAAAAHGFDLRVLGILSHAAAGSGFSTITHDLANATEVVVLKLALAEWTEDEKAEAYLAVDRIVAALATFAFDGDANALRVSKVLYEQDFLAPFASSLFTPLALEKIELWPVFWNRLVDQAARPSELFGQEPREEWRVRLGDNFDIQAAHFDTLHVFEDLIASAVAKGYSLQDIYDAAGAGNLSARTNELAEAVLLEIELRSAIMRRRTDDCDEVFLNPNKEIFRPLMSLPRTRWTARVSPRSHHDWKPAAGHSPKEREKWLVLLILEACPPHIGRI